MTLIWPESEGHEIYVNGISRRYVFETYKHVHVYKGQILN